MKNFRKVCKHGLIAMMLCTAMILGLVGCGEKGTYESEIVYVAEFMDLEEVADVCAVKELNGVLHIITAVYEEESASYKLIRLNLTDKSRTEDTLESALGGYFSTIHINDDGTIEVIEDKSEYDEEWKLLSQELFFNQYDAEGKMISSEPAREKFGLEEGFYISIFMKDKEGNYFIGSWDSALMIYSPEFVKISEITGNGDYWDSLCMTGSGTVVTSYWGNMNVTIAPLDVQAGKVGTAVETEKSSGSADVWGGLGDSILYVDGTVLYSYDLSTATTQVVMDTMDLDVNGEFIREIYPLEDGRYVMLYFDYMANGAGIVVATPVDPSTIAEKTELTLATLYASQDLNNAVIKFNQTNAEYRIKVIDYATEDYDFNAALTNLQNDIVAGNVPDIIDVSSTNIPWRNWAGKGILTDLYPLMETDGEFDKEDLMDNVRSAMEIEDSLYVLPASFNVSCVMAKTDNVAGITSLTPATLLEMERNLPEDTDLFYYNDQYTVMYNMVYECLDSYVDYENGECNFDSDEFKAVLAYAKEQPAVFEYEEGVSVPGRLQTDKVIFYEAYLNQVTDYQFNKAVFGGDITCFGYGGNDEDGIQMGMSGVALAITGDCEHKDVAWQFVKSFLGEEYQESDYMWGIPATKDGFETFLDNAQNMEGTHSYGWDDVQMEIVSATDKEVEEFRALVEMADTITYSDQALLDIIQEEVEPYFQGQKSVDEVTDIIQSRIDIYLKESL